MGDESRVTQAIGRVERDRQPELERLKSGLEQVYENNESLGFSATAKSGRACHGPECPSFSVSTGFVAGAAELQSPSANAWL
jgi:hypothetical protein